MPNYFKIKKEGVLLKHSETANGNFDFAEAVLLVAKRVECSR